MPSSTPITLQALQDIAERHYDAFPALERCARELGQELLKQHTGLDYDPDLVYWHRFNNANTNHQTFTDWEHYGPPERSMSITRLILERFDVTDQVNSIDLNTMSGVYQDDANARVYDQHNEVKVTPLSLMDDLWSLDFAQAYKQRLEHFWDSESSNGRLLMKALFFSGAWKAYADGVLTTNQLKMLISAMAGPTQMPPTLDDLRTEFGAREQVTVHTFSIGELVAPTIVRVKCPGNIEIIYIPNQEFLVFHSAKQQYEWISQNAADPASRKRLLGHFVDYSSAATEHRQALQDDLDTMARHPWAPGQTLLNRHTRALTGDVFTHLYENVWRRLAHDANTLLTSNYALRKQLFMVDLDGLLRISIGLAPIDPLAAMVTLGAASVSFGMHTATAVRGETRETRRAAFLAALADALTILFDLPLLKGKGLARLAEFADLERATGVYSISGTVAETAIIADPELAALAVKQPAGLLIPGSGIKEGVLILDAEHLYIRMQGSLFQVRYLDLLERWVIIDPLNAQELWGTRPVERDWNDRWQLYTESGTASAAVEPVPARPASPIESVAVEVQGYETSPRYEFAVQTLIGRDAERLMTGPIDSVLQDARSELIGLREKLARRSREFFAAPRPAAIVAVPEVSAQSTPDEFFEAVFSDAYGLVVGEAPGCIASKKLLIKYMAQLKELGVDTLYLQGLSKDLHQAGLDEYLTEQFMVPTLAKHLRRMNGMPVSLTHNRFTPYQLVKQARRQGIKVKALDCVAALGSEGLPASDPQLAASMRNYYALQRIRASRLLRPEGKWVALVDHTRVGRYLNVPGLAELTECVGLRIKDMPWGSATRLAADAGEVLKNSRALVKGDVRLEMGTLISAADLLGSDHLDG
jgi:hypothetical protein